MAQATSAGYVNHLLCFNREKTMNLKTLFAPATAIVLSGAMLVPANAQEAPHTLPNKKTLVSANQDSQLVQTKILFASAEEGSKFIGEHDDYIDRITSFDTQSKMQTNNDEKPSAEEFAHFLSQHTIDWGQEEKRRVAVAIDKFARQSADLSLNFPEKIFFVLTTGEEEGGAAYTRGNAIFLPKPTIMEEWNQEKLDAVVIHEFFHVLTRHNPKLRDELYKTIGFHKCDEVELLLILRNQKITNPDAPRNEHVIKIQVDGEDHWALPILFAEEEYDIKKEKVFYQYISVKLLLLEPEEKISNEVPTKFKIQSPVKLCAPTEVAGFFEQIGENTRYIYHGEETCADHFVFLVQGKRDLPSYELIEKMRKVLDEHGKNYQAKPALSLPLFDIK